jgi:hypothetical protein
MTKSAFLRATLTAIGIVLTTSAKAEWVDMEFPKSSGFSNTYIDLTTLRISPGTGSVWWASDTPNASNFSSLSFLTEFNCITGLHRNLLAYAHTDIKGGGSRIEVSKIEPWIAVNPRTKASYIMTLVCRTSNSQGR